MKHEDYYYYYYYCPPFLLIRQLVIFIILYGFLMGKTIGGGFRKSLQYFYN